MVAYHLQPIDRLDSSLSLLDDPTANYATSRRAWGPKRRCRVISTFSPHERPATDGSQPFFYAYDRFNTAYRRQNQGSQGQRSPGLDKASAVAEAEEPWATRPISLLHSTCGSYPGVISVRQPTEASCVL